MKRIAIIFALLAVLSGAEQLTAQTLRYRLIDLGTLGGPNSTEGPQAPIVTDTGSVIGVADTSIPDPLCTSDCFICVSMEKGTLSDLGTIPGGSRSDAIWANRLGLIIGKSENGLINPLVGVPENRAVGWPDHRPRNSGWK